MKSRLLLLNLVFCISTALANSSSKPYKVVCYLGSWANYRSGEGKFVIEDIDPKLCTHLIYGFAKLSNDKITIYDTYLDLKENWGLGAFDRFNDLRKKNPHLKTLIAIGGWNEGSVKYSQMAGNPASRRTFVDSCMDFLAKHKFDGLDLDWEYPANRGGKPEDKQNFVSLIKSIEDIVKSAANASASCTKLYEELREAFEPRGYLLSAAVAAGQQTIDSAYDIPALGKYLHFINLMTYDFHGGWDKVTGHNAPLYARPNETEANKKLNVDYTVNYWLSKGAPREKLILGMAVYGRGFSLQDPKIHGLDAPINGNGMAGEFTMQPGMLGYNEICKLLKNDKGWNIVVEPYLLAPYAIKGNQWVGYDDVKSITLKVNYIRRMHLGGGMIWSLETDDFRGKCHGHKYPLLTAIHEGLNGPTVNPNQEPDQENSIPPEIIQNSSTTADISTSTTSPVVDNVTTEATDGDLLPCPYSGYFRHPKDCKIFYFCQTKTSTTKTHLYYMFRCSEGTVFSQEIRVCAFPSSVPGCS